MTIAVVVGTRPEIIKMSPVVMEMDRRKMDYALIFTGQHYDERMAQVFFDELGFPTPDVTLEVGSGTQGEQTGRALTLLEAAFMRDHPEVVVVEGDTNTVLASGLAAAKLGIPVAHVEAGLRSHDRRMPEEHNRRLTDHISTLLFAPTQFAADNLAREGITSGVTVTGNTVIDACVRYLPAAMDRPPAMPNADGDFALVTLHRMENVDDPAVLSNLVSILRGLPVPAIFPAHPRTVKRLREMELEGRMASGGVAVIEPVGYLEFLHLLSRCAFVITDSGGIQEEVTAPGVRKKAFVLRESTERPEAEEAGFVEVLGTEPDEVLRRITQFIGEGWRPPDVFPYGDGNAGRRIVDVFETWTASGH